jgi:hypothetical protein
MAPQGSVLLRCDDEFVETEPTTMVYEMTRRDDLMK